MEGFGKQRLRLDLHKEALPLSRAPELSVSGVGCRISSACCEDLKRQVKVREFGQHEVLGRLSALYSEMKTN